MLNKDAQHASKTRQYVAVNHSNQETEEFTNSFVRMRVFKDTEQIVQDAHSKATNIEKPSKYVELE